MNKKAIIDIVRSRMGFDALNPVQLSILSSESRRIVLLAPTGSGKTVAFTIAILKNIGEPGDGTSAIVVAPSRELAVQTGEVMRKCAAGYKVSVIYGGHRMQDEVSSIEGGTPDIVVATPGRLLDHLNRGTLTLKDMRAFVIDEYDKLLELGFEDEMKKISRKFPRKVSLIMLTSATEIEPLPAYMDLKDAETVDYRERSSDPRDRMQVVEIESFQKDKLPVLRDLLLTMGQGEKSIVFVNHRESAERIYGDLKKNGFAAALYHGGLDQQQRELAVDLFNNGSANVIVATDLAARGLDIADVDAIVHYHFPLNEATYTHRNGRTARVDASGTIYVIRSEEEGLPDFIVTDRTLCPAPDSDSPVKPENATLYLNVGRQQKISRGDIVGYLLNNTSLTASEIGKINIGDRFSIVAVPYAKARETMAQTKGKKIKNKSVLITEVKL